MRHDRTTDVAHTLRAGLVVAVLAGPQCVPTPCSAQANDGRVPVSLVFSSSAMRRDVALITAAGQATHRLTELGLVRLVPALEDQGATGIAARAGQLYLISLPLASLTGVLSHEFGHVEYLRRSDVGWDIAIAPWPWPFPTAGGVTQGTGPLPPGASHDERLREHLPDQPLAARADGRADRQLPLP